MKILQRVLVSARIFGQCYHTRQFYMTQCWLFNSKENDENKSEHCRCFFSSFFSIDFVSLRVASAIISVFDFGSVQNQLGPATIKTPTYFSYQLLCVCVFLQLDDLDI